MPSEINKGIKSLGKPELDAKQFTSWFEKKTNHLLNSIPNEIKLKQQKIEKQTRKVILLFFSTAIIFIVGSVIYGVSAYETNKETKEMLKKNLTTQEANWLIKFYNEVGDKNPKDTQKFIDTYGEIPQVDRN